MKCHGIQFNFCIAQLCIDCQIALSLNYDTLYYLCVTEEKRNYFGSG